MAASTVSRALSKPGRVSFRTAEHVRTVAARLGYRTEDPSRDCADGHLADRDGRRGHHQPGLLRHDPRRRTGRPARRLHDGARREPGVRRGRARGPRAHRARGRRASCSPRPGCPTPRSARWPSPPGWSCSTALVDQVPIVVDRHHRGGAASPPSTCSSAGTHASPTWPGRRLPGPTACAGGRARGGPASWRSRCAGSGPSDHHRRRPRGGGRRGWHQPSSAVIAYNDLLAIGFHAGRRPQAGAGYPSDVSVIGFDNIRVGELIVARADHHRLAAGQPRLGGGAAPAAATARRARRPRPAAAAEPAGRPRLDRPGPLRPRSTEPTVRAIRQLPATAGCRPTTPSR